MSSQHLESLIGAAGRQLHNELDDHCEQDDHLHNICDQDEEEHV
jgi:hypothetical protein